ncbi:hypothetical protein O5699_04195 [Escherichia coli]|nr:hypothetical protein [Escherichia coli]
MATTPMASGEMDPDIQPALDAVFAAGHNILICPFSTTPALAALKQHPEKPGTRWNSVARLVVRAGQVVWETGSPWQPV